MNLPQLFHNAAFGGVAAAGFGVLFHIGIRALPWCVASGALALTVRTIALASGWSLEAASFVAALTLGAAAQLIQSRITVSRNALEVVGCIPMIPGGFAAKAILGLFAVATQHAPTTHEPFILAVENTWRAAFTIGALGTGLAMPTLLMRVRGISQARTDRGTAQSGVMAPAGGTKSNDPGPLFRRRGV